MDAASDTESERWLSIAGKLLASRDFAGARTFVIRARESDPTNPIPSLILAVVETLTTADTRIGDSLFDWYSILGVPRLSADARLIEERYHELVTVLGKGGENGVPLAEEAVGVAVEAWGVLGDGTRKWLYDGELGLYLQSVRQQNVDVNTLHFFQGSSQRHQTNPRSQQGREWQDRNDNANANANVNVNDNGNGDGNVVGETFWSACPYCYYFYEYAKVYEDCTLRCENCTRGFHAGRVPNPPPVGDGRGKDEEESFCCWGFYPLGFSMTKWKRKDGVREGPGWAPFSPIFACPVNGNGVAGGFGAERKVGGWGSGPRVYVEDDEAYADISDDDFDSDTSNDISWGRANITAKNKMGMSMGRRGRRPNWIRREGLTRAKRVLRGETSKHRPWGPVRDATVVLGLKANTSKIPGSSYLRKQIGRPTRDRGKLDLNVELSNEAEDHAPAVSAGNEQEEPIEGIGFFEGLDEFFSSLPILNGVETEKAKPS